jgi:hypothetical protein
VIACVQTAAKHLECEWAAKVELRIEDHVVEAIDEQTQRVCQLVHHARALAHAEHQQQQIVHSLLSVPRRGRKAVCRT